MIIGFGTSFLLLSHNSQFPRNPNISVKNILSDSASTIFHFRNLQRFTQPLRENNPTFLIVKWAFILKPYPLALDSPIRSKTRPWLERCMKVSSKCQHTKEENFTHLLLVPLSVYSNVVWHSISHILLMRLNFSQVRLEPLLI